ncbi:hypothetical protein F5Y16DRAFT_374757 [Xylariaceae sp. FL0255]|nr:hypothetical protein F5Y16DRAFT_374757 [Xylariaceae sp. FL0255]
MAPMDYELMPPPPRPAPRSRSRSRSRPTAQPENGIQYLDRWAPDRDHSRRVSLHRERSRSVSRHRRERSMSRNRVESGRISRPGSRHGPVSGAPGYPKADVANDHLADKFSQELEYYDNQISSLRQGEWPSTPDPRAPALRISGAEFSEQKARELKAWNSAQSFMYGAQSSSLRNSDVVHPKEAYEPGTIFSTSYHTNGSDQRWVSVSDPHNTATPFGTVHSKFRKMVVVRKFGSHCLCVPIFTSNGHGLEKKPDFLHEEFVSIRDAFDDNPEPAEGPNRPLLAMKYRSCPGSVIAGKASVKLTEFYSHNFESPATIEGYLDDRSDSTWRLLDLTKGSLY